MYKDLADFSIKFLQEKGADYAEARLEDHTSTGIILKDSNPEITGFDQSAGLGIRFLINNNLGFVSINELKKEKLKEQLEKSIKITQRASKISEKINFSEEKPVKKVVAKKETKPKKKAEVPKAKELVKKQETKKKEEKAKKVPTTKELKDKQ